MSEERFVVETVAVWEKVVTDKEKCYTYEDSDEIVDVLNEQQSTIQRMKHSLNTIYKAFEKHYGYDMRNAIWLIDELSYDDNEIGFDSDE